jgi:hypothetical protein
MLENVKFRGDGRLKGKPGLLASLGLIVLWFFPPSPLDFKIKSPPPFRGGSNQTIGPPDWRL